MSYVAMCYINKTTKAFENSVFKGFCRFILRGSLL